MDSTDSLSRYIDRYIDVRTFTATAHARRYAQTKPAGFSQAESAGYLDNPVLR